MKKNYLFKSYTEGTGKTSHKPFRILELHDIDTLENTQFFIPQGHSLPALPTLKLKDAVEIEHGITVFNGRPNMTVETISKSKF